jgi:hypothetical protein
MELAEFEAPRTFLETICAPRNKRLGIPMMKENCKKKNYLDGHFCANRTHFDRYFSTT